MRLNILFIIYHGFTEHSGISKKIRYQVKALNELNHSVHVCYYDFDNDGNRARYIDGSVLQNFGSSKLSALRQRLELGRIVDFAIKNKIDFVYSRSYMNANPFIVNLFKSFKKHGIKAVIEIPTYPYDNEFAGLLFKDKVRLFIDKIYRNSLAKQVDRIVTFSDYETIFGQKTCCISNGIDFDSIPLKCLKEKRNDSPINFIAVAEVHYWHGFDRFIHGIGEYYKNGGTRDIYFHIVGGIAKRELYDSCFARGFNNLIDEYRISEKVIFHGELFGDELDKVFESSDFAIGSLARHRSYIQNIKTLKNREYAARGIPFIYSENDSDFDDKPYVLKVPADESAIDIKRVLEFYDSLDIAPEDIRISISNLSWKKQMQFVLDAVIK